MSESKSFWGRVNWGLRFPLLGMLLFWYLFVAGIFAENLQNINNFDLTNNNPNPPQFVHPMIYFMLLGLAILVVTALLGRRIAASKLAAEPALRINQNTYTFTTVSILIALIGAAFLAISVFLSNLSFGGTPERDPVVRLFSLYVPIVLDAAILLFGILRAFVVKPKGAKNV